MQWSSLYNVIHLYHSQFLWTPNEVLLRDCTAFLSLKINFVQANSADPEEMPHLTLRWCSYKNFPKKLILKKISRQQFSRQQ